MFITKPGGIVILGHGLMDVTLYMGIARDIDDNTICVIAASIRKTVP